MASNHTNELMMDALQKRYEGQLTYIDVHPNHVSDRNFTVRMVLNVSANDELEIYLRLRNVLDICLKDES